MFGRSFVSLIAQSTLSAYLAGAWGSGDEVLSFGWIYIQHFCQNQQLHKISL